MAEYTVKHVTRYSYQEEVSHCHNLAHMCPVTNRHQDCNDLKLHVLPGPSVSSYRKDYFGNLVYSFSVEDSHKSLEIVSESKVTTHPVDYGDLSHSPKVSEIPILLKSSHSKEDLEALEYVADSAFVSKNSLFADFALEMLDAEKPLLQAVSDYTLKFFNTFEFKSGATTIHTPPAQVLKNRKGVCQDFTHLSIAALRSLGIPCRYVSGYIETFPPPGQKKLQGSDASHAWFSVYSPGIGWVDYDPTNGKMLSEEYIFTSVGRDFADVSPLKGILFGGGKHKLKVEVDVIREYNGSRYDL
ncbi:transglutaminase family protein [Leptospira kmetyi]|uniref:Transglutaminase family protein n=1 Tax=Leptospira kmetyi TaxID=408139 RepID=A0A2M9XVA3_9LEPT|nr:transglutaminase family protein [Leptospira kmetyi]AYV57144.1 transglutaminase family protein [Leptospira kmetyi]EQA55244.1 transglutaminase-like protein [Leptospira kmetyi serovar Malaysia str. Bejo-Iso9]PJZ31864.1 transglutaminase family protein [Leptospira kmetyi]PJZ43188.1 transglutaminase family protein [Leptospira kmetyi]TGK21492.1 transglutaminase family protein [Leptospira kmetyi]